MDGEEPEEAVGEKEKGKRKQNSLELEHEKDELKSFQKSFNVRTVLHIYNVSMYTLFL